MIHLSQKGEKRRCYWTREKKKKNYVDPKEKEKNCRGTKRKEKNVELTYPEIPKTSNRKNGKIKV
jgi:hypothetical protein